MNVVPPPGDGPVRYSGTVNLEAMSEAANYNRFLTELVGSIVGSRSTIADFGAGIGTFAERLRPRVAHLSCIEPDADQATRLRALGFDTFTSLAAIADRSLDAIYSLNVLEHIEDDELVLAQIHRKLRIGGKFLVYVPAFSILFSDMDRLVGHVRRYRLGELRRKVSGAGFAVDIARYADSVGFLATLAYRAVGRGGGRLNPRTVAWYDRQVFPISRALDAFGASRWIGKNVFVIATATA